MNNSIIITLRFSLAINPKIAIYNKNIVIYTACVSACTNMGHNGVPFALAWSISGVDRLVKSHKKWQENNPANINNDVI
jgi:hypothetical protein